MRYSVCFRGDLNISGAAGEEAVVVEGVSEEERADVVSGVSGRVSDREEDEGTGDSRLPPSASPFCRMNV